MTENRIENTVASKSTDPKPVSPTGLPMLPQSVVRWVALAVAIAGIVVTLPTQGVMLPPAVLAVAGSVVALGAAFGIVSQGVRKTDKP